MTDRCVLPFFLSGIFGTRIPLAMVFSVDLDGVLIGWDFLGLCIPGIFCYWYIGPYVLENRWVIMDSYSEFSLWLM